MSNSDQTHGSSLTRINLFLSLKVSLPENTAGAQHDSGTTAAPKTFCKKLLCQRKSVAVRFIDACYLLIVALAVNNPNYKIRNADECEQRSEETPNVNQAPLAERAVYHQIEPTMQRGAPVPTNVPTVESRKRPAKERGNQLSRPRCHQEIPEIIHRKIFSVHLSENQITICHLFLPPQRQFAGKRGKRSTVILGEVV